MVTHEEAERRVNIGFAIHMAAYLGVITGLSIMNYRNNPEHMWVVWVAAGWGLGVVLHGVNILVPQQREKMVDRVTARMEKREMRR